MAKYFLDSPSGSDFGNFSTIIRERSLEISMHSFLSPPLQFKNILLKNITYLYINLLNLYIPIKTLIVAQGPKFSCLLRELHFLKELQEKGASEGVITSWT